MDRIVRLQFDPKDVIPHSQPLPQALMKRRTHADPDSMWVLRRHDNTCTIRVYPARFHKTAPVITAAFIKDTFNPRVPIAYLADVTDESVNLNLLLAQIVRQFALSMMFKARWEYQVCQWDYIIEWQFVMD